jgi:hypothetical protein
MLVAFLIRPLPEPRPASLSRVLQPVPAKVAPLACARGRTRPARKRAAAEAQRTSKTRKHRSSSCSCKGVWPNVRAHVPSRGASCNLAVVSLSLFPWPPLAIINPPPPPMKKSGGIFDYRAFRTKDKPCGPAKKAKVDKGPVNVSNRMILARGSREENPVPPQFGRVSSDTSPRPPARVLLEQSRRPGLRPTLRPRCEKNAAPAPSRHVPASYSRTAACPCLYVRATLRASCAKKRCVSAAWPRPRRRKPVSPPPGARPTREKPCVRSPGSIPLERNPNALPARHAPCSPKDTRPCQPARVLLARCPSSPPTGTGPAEKNPMVTLPWHASSREKPCVSRSRFASQLSPEIGSLSRSRPNAFAVCLSSWGDCGATACVGSRCR